MSTTQVFPPRLRPQSVAVESETLFSEEESVGMRMSKYKLIVVAALTRAQCDLGLYAWGSFIAAKQLVVGATLPLNELSESVRAEHPTQHVEETNEIGLSGAVGANQHCRPGISESSTFASERKP